MPVGPHNGSKLSFTISCAILFRMFGMSACVKLNGLSTAKCDMNINAKTPQS